MSRRGDSVYEERDYYRDERSAPPVRTQVRERDFEETDVYSRRGPESARGSRPDFLRDDYGRTEPGQMVVRERDTEISRPMPNERTMERTMELSRPLERRPRSPSPVRIREERRERIIRRSPSPPPVETTFRSRVVERERARSLTPPPPQLRARVTETREFRRERSPSPVRYRERVVERERSPSPVRFRERIIERERERERTPSPPRVDTIRIQNIERETRRIPSPSPSPSPPPAPIRAPPIHQEIITHHRHIDHGFERARVPTPPPPPRRTKEVKETDIDIHTSRNGNNTEIDIKTSRSKTPQPTSNSIARRHDFYDDSILYDHEHDKLRVRDTKLDIGRRRSMSARPGRGEHDHVKVDIRESYGRERDNYGRESTVSIRGDEDEADYYRRKTDERAYIGEAYNGATKDWAIVDVPPGTERVQMDGVGGGSQEVTWQRYNGVRRSKFIPERERMPERFPERERERIEIREREEPRHESSGLEIEISSSSRRQPSGAGTYEREYERIEETTSDRRVGMPRPPPAPKNRDLWTEITKDLVLEEAIRKLGYSFEETEYFYYIIEYLRYEDVLELVEVSEQIKRERQHRIREIERERERFERRAREREEWERAERAERRRDRDSGYDEERLIEREIVYEGSDRRGPPRRRW